MVSVYSVTLCEQVINKEGKVDLRDVLHTLATPSFPTNPLTFSLFMLASRDNSPNRGVTVRISPPDVTADSCDVGGVEVDDEPGELAVMSCQLTCAFGAPGPYFFNVFCGNALIGQTKLLLKQADQPAYG